eukprot:s684_g24.t1
MFVTCQFALSWAVGRTSPARYCTLHELSHDCIAVKVRREGDFSSLAVEKDAMEEKLKAFAEHVQGGGVGAWFPEGMRNRGDPLVLQEFRAGAFSVAVQTDVDVWCLAMLGTNVCWPVESLVGGIPARIGIRMWKLGSSHALLAAESLPDCDTRTKAIRLAGLVKASIQEGLEDLAAKGFSDQRNARNEEAKSK